jgi:LacI family transcriptional regulator
MPRRPAGQADDERRTTIRDVAARAGVSVATVSRVLAGNYPTAPTTRTKVMRAVKDLDYVVNAHARALAGVSAKTVAILLSEVTTPFYAFVAQGVEQQAAQEGRLCLVCTTGADPERELAIVKLMREQRADAVILVGGVVETEEYMTRMTQYAHALSSSGSKLVLCGRPGLGPDVPALVVHYDNEGGAYGATSHLLSAGHDRILFLGGVPGNTTYEARLRGHARALSDRAIPLDPDLVIRGGGGQGFGYETMRARLAVGPPNFTAVFAAEDSSAAGAMQAIREAGLTVPADISVIGYDDIPMAQHMSPPLTTVHIPAEELGRAAVRAALHTDELRTAGRRDIVLGTHVVVRDSVARR